MGETPHDLVNPSTLLEPVGFSHAVVAAPGRTVWFGGQTSHREDGTQPEGLVPQFEQAVANIGVALEAVGGRPEHLTSIMVYVTDVAAYRASLRDLGAAYRRHLGRHYPAMALFEVTGLFDPDSLVELVPTAVIPDEG